MALRCAMALRYAFTLCDALEEASVEEAGVYDLNNNTDSEPGFGLGFNHDLAGFNLDTPWIRMFRIAMLVYCVSEYVTQSGFVVVNK